MRVGIGLVASAYTPEAYAYEKFLAKKGIDVQLEDENNLCENNDVNVYFMGFRPFWHKSSGRALEVHEYQSLSTGKLPKFKNLIKRKFNKIPAGRIFLNEIVHREFSFEKSTPYICRDMGVDEDFFCLTPSIHSYDIVYSGSISGRSGLLNEIKRLSDMGFRILVIGEISIVELQFFGKRHNIEFTGRLPRSELPALYRKCKAGLNFTPDIYPFNIQTSTKTLEYLASGLSVISNRYKWAVDFSAAVGVNMIYTDEITNYFDMIPVGKLPIEYEWGRLLDRSGFFEFISNI